MSGRLASEGGAKSGTRGSRMVREVAKAWNAPRPCKEDIRVEE
jgi:hypothetical protein